MKNYGMGCVSLLLLLLPPSLPDASGAEPEDARLANTGKIRVAPKGEVYVRGALRMAGAGKVNVNLQGGLTSEGNFYFDPGSDAAEGHVFDPDAEGRLRFVPNSNESETDISKRYIGVYSGSVEAFDRAAHYIAFPHLVIGVDTLELPARMGIDALSVTQSTNEALGSRHKKLLLKSQAYTVSGGGEKAFDASLRITGKNPDGSSVSADFVTPGAVVVERCLSPYRPTNSENANAVYFSFATPFDKQYSAYFATNWVRTMLEDEQTGHVAFPYGDQTDSNGKILREQYLYDYRQPMEAGKGYLIRLRPKGYDYGNLHLSHGIHLPGIGDLEDLDDLSATFDTDTYVFDGTPPLSGLSDTEQLFANDVLFDRSINLTPTNTINWVIGNSYTAPISLDSLIKVLGASDLNISSQLYILPAGCASYHTVDMVNHTETNEGNKTIALIDINVIPAMSYFMIRLAKNKEQDGRLILGKDLLVHNGETPHGLRAAKAYDNELVFRVAPAYQDNFYDLAGIGLRPGYAAAADGKDVVKMSAATGEVFSLYTLASDRTPLSVNMLPEESETALMGFVAGEVAGPFRLQTERMESLRTEGLWLEDLKTGGTTDLLLTGGEYVFETEPGDAPERFRLRFVRAASGTDENRLADIGLYYSNGVLYLSGLCSDDRGAALSVSDASGKLCLLETVRETETRQRFDLGHLPKGVYLARLQGKRTATLKIMK